MSNEWAVQNTITKNIDDVVPYDSNPREHAPEQIEQVANSIKEFGWTMPILIDENNEIIAGHGRLLAGKSLGIKEVPCIVAKGWSDEKKKAYCIADNKLTENSTWSKDFLKLNFEFLIDNEFDLGLTGFSTDEIAKIVPDFMIEEGLTDEDEVLIPPEDPITKLGYTWLCGEHRVMCGDSTSADDVGKLMNTVKADMIFTDPPYNADYKSRGEDELLRKGIKNDAMSDESFDNFIDGFLPMLFSSTKAGASFYICCNWKDSYPRFYNHITNAGMNVSSCIVWNKKSGGMGWQDYRYQYELIIYGFKKDEAHIWYGGRTETDIWSCSREVRSNYVHPTQKPIELIERALKNSSKSEDCILDLFGGSGSTLIACQKTKRKGYLMELDPIYVDVIVKRWQNYTGKDAVLESTGELFNNLK